MVSSRPLDTIRVNQSPTLLVFRNTFDSMATPHRILKVVTFPLVYRFSFSTSLSAPPIPAPNAPDSLRIPVSTRPPNTPHHRGVESEPLNGENEQIPSELTTTVEPPSTLATALDENNSATTTQENNDNDNLTASPPLIHNSEN